MTIWILLGIVIFEFGLIVRLERITSSHRRIINAVEDFTKIHHHCVECNKPMMFSDHETRLYVCKYCIKAKGRDHYSGKKERQEDIDLYSILSQCPMMTSKKKKVVAKK